jgi:uncharacterized Rossmann fold enzyme
MEFTDWKPVYERILADFGYDRAADERARDLLAEHCEDRPSPAPAVTGVTVAVAGAGPSLGVDIDALVAADAVFAASGAAATLRERGVAVDLMVTDLDKVPDTAVALTREGTPVAVHAHGDNCPAIKEYVPKMDPEWVLPTTQARPVPPVGNYGGFTDGDRTAFLADHLGADTLTFAGWDFEDPAVSADKRHKLRWAARLLRWLEVRRGERFAVLDGHRAGLDIEGFPV